MNYLEKRFRGYARRQGLYAVEAIKSAARVSPSLAVRFEREAVKYATTAARWAHRAETAKTAGQDCGERAHYLTEC